MFRPDFAPTTKFPERYLALHFFLVFLAPVVYALARSAREFD